MTDRVHGKIDLEAVLAEALRALAVLDADAIEGLAEFLEGNSASLVLPRSAAEWMRLRSRHWVLGHLLDGTGRRLEMLRRVCSPSGRLGNYGDRSLRGVSPHRTMRLVQSHAGSKVESFASHVAAGKTAN